MHGHSKNAGIRYKKIFPSYITYIVGRTTVTSVSMLATGIVGATA